MKIQSLLLFTFLVLLSSCFDAPSSSVKQQKPKTILEPLAKDKIIIHGQTDYYADEYLLQLVSKDRKEIIKMDSLQFKFEFQKDRPILIKLSNAHRSIPIFAMPGDSIKIDFKLIDFMNQRHTQQYSGSRKAENEILAQLNAILFMDNPHYYHLYNVDTDDFLGRLDSLETLGREIKANGIKAHKIKNEYFSQYYDVFLQYSLGVPLKKYPKIWEKSLAKGVPDLNANYQKRKSALFVESPEWLNNYPYVAYLKGRIDEHINPRSGAAYSFQMIDSLYSDASIEAYLKFDFTKNVLNNFQFFQKQYEEKSRNKQGTATIGGGNLRALMANRAKRVHEFVDYYFKEQPPAHYEKQIREQYAALISKPL